MGAITTRLPDGLKEEGEAYAASLGVSLNALLAVALRDYLDARRPMRTSAAPSSALPPATPLPPPLAAQEAPPVAPTPAPAPTGQPDPPGRIHRKPKGGNSAPCPCGKLDRHGYRLMWKHCHGQTG